MSSHFSHLIITTETLCQFSPVSQFSLSREEKYFCFISTINDQNSTNNERVAFSKTLFITQMMMMKKKNFLGEIKSIAKKYINNYKPQSREYSQMDLCEHVGLIRGKFSIDSRTTFGIFLKDIDTQK